MKIYVCVKHVSDSAANIIIKERNKFDESVKYVINPYDEIAVEIFGERLPAQVAMTPLVDPRGERLRA